MTEDVPTDGDWRRTCPQCGSELATVQVQFAEADFSDGRTGTPVARDVCPDPDCPRHRAELATLEGAEISWVEPPEGSPPTGPGSLGGDNGGG